MRDGGKVESKRETESGDDANEFGRSVSKIAVAQICETVGFERFNKSALEALTDIGVRYLSELGKRASFYANLAGRTECNVFDAIQGFEELGLSRGFAGASEGGRCLTGSGTVREIVEYVESAAEIPFAQPVSHFPVVRDESTTPRFMHMNETETFKHIPPWLPAFPDPHTYIHTPTWNDRVTDPRTDKIELARQRRKAGRSLLSLRHQLLCNGSAVTSTSTDEINDGKALQVGKTKNPFLAMPLQAREKDVALVTLPAKRSYEAVGGDHVVVLDTLVSAIEEMKGGYCDSEEIDKKVLPDKRPAVSLKFKRGEKTLGGSLDLSLWSKGSGKNSI